jgi:alkanesulfonate monooxygenase SsuD/methylene tetrahydromethanopterin reductase-like flavin-dependent oxidoreductase (luciferase family)
MERMRVFTAEVRAALAQQGRAEDASRVLMSIMPFVGESRAEAEDKRDLHDSLVDPLVGLSTLGAHANADFSGLALDASVEAVTSSGSQGNIAALKSIAAGKSISIADAGRIYGRGVMCPRLVGTAKDIADEMAEIVASGATDGFVVSPAFLPDTFEDFVDGVVPILQDKGLFRRDYEGITLRDHLGFGASTP